MTYVLVDNATLTGVQRLLGEIPLKSRDVVDADIGALENLIYGILFFDTVVCIDDYKEEYREQRRSRFAFVRFLDPAAFGISDVANAASKLATTLEPMISAGEFADNDLRPLLDRLRMHMTCTWDLVSSVYYLTMKVLGAPDAEELKKYSRLQAAIFGELQDLFSSGGRYDTNVTLVDSHGKPIRAGYSLGERIPTGGNTKQLEAFIAALRWLAHRTTFYSLAADHLRADLLLSPIRQAYHLHFMQKTGRYSSEFVTGTVTALGRRVGDTVGSIAAAGQPLGVPLSLPVFSAWLVNQTGDVRTVVEEALRIRDNHDIRTAREQLREIRHLFDADATADASRRAQRLLNELDNSLAVVRRRYGLTTQQGVTAADVVNIINPALSAAGGPALPALGKDVRLPLWMAERWPLRGVGALYRDVARDLADFPRLGRIRDLLGAAVDSETNDAQSSHVKVEHPMYRGRRTDWKIPM